MSDVYQHTVADGSPNWSPGSDTFGVAWAWAHDQLRFHRGKQFSINDGPPRTLNQIDQYLQPQLEREKPGTVFKVKALLDGFTVGLRRIAVKPTAQERAMAWVESKFGTPYVLGGTDCSWYTLSLAAQFGLGLPHNAHQQHLLLGKVAGFVPIKPAQRKPGDLTWHHTDEHVSIYWGDYKGTLCAADEQPHDAPAPWGGMLGVGARIRPITGNYYDADVYGACGRIVAINGQP